MQQDKFYVKGFNSGYLLRSKSLELAKIIIESVKGKSVYLDGIKDGYRQFELEQNKELLPKIQREQKLLRIRNHQKDNNKGLDFER